MNEVIAEVIKKLLVVLPVQKCDSLFTICLWMNLSSNIEQQLLILTVLRWQGSTPACSESVTEYCTLKHIRWTKASLDERSSILSIAEGRGEQPNISFGSSLAWHIDFTSTQYNVPHIIAKLEMHHKTVTLWRLFLPHKKAKQREALLNQTAATAGCVRSAAKDLGALKADWVRKDLLNTWRPVDQAPTKKLTIQWKKKSLVDHLTHEIRWNNNPCEGTQLLH